MEAGKLTPPFVVAEGLVLVLWIVSFLMTVSCIYLYAVSSADIERDIRPRSFLPNIKAVGFFALIFVALAIIHWIVRHQHIQTAVTVLAGSLALIVMYYFHWIRESWTNDRIRYAVLLWAIFWLLTGILLATLVWMRRRGFEFRIFNIDSQSAASYIGTFFQIAGIIIAATMVVVTNRQNAREADENARQANETARQADETVRQHIYTTLETESVRLFRFECDHAELVTLLWGLDDGASEDNQSPSEVRTYQLRQYICQILNLFEMACRFRKQEIMEPEVFGSWVIWMWELCTQDTFRRHWPGKDGIEFNYVADLREIMNAGLYFADKSQKDFDPTSGDRRSSFFWFVATAVGDIEHVQTWLNRSTADLGKFKKYWVREQAAA